MPISSAHNSPIWKNNITIPMLQILLWCVLQHHIPAKFAVSCVSHDHPRTSDLDKFGTRSPREGALQMGPPRHLQLGLFCMQYRERQLQKPMIE